MIDINPCFESKRKEMSILHKKRRTLKRGRKRLWIAEHLLFLLTLILISIVFTLVARAYDDDFSQPSEKFQEYNYTKEQVIFSEGLPVWRPQ